MDIIEAVILGLVQGLTEFIPVSSSGHLVLLSKIFGIESGGLTFEILLHAATLIAVMIAFEKDIWKMIRKPLSKINYLLITATAVTAAIYLIFKDAFESMFEKGEYIGFAFLFTGIIILMTGISKGVKPAKKDIADIEYTDAAFIGLLQGIAIVPGISRSGLTIAAGLSVKIDRETAVRFSILLSIPAIIGGLLSDIPGMTVGTLAGIGILPVVCGAAAAFISGFTAIKFLIKFVSRHGVRPFAYYVLILGILTVLDRFVFNLVF